MSYDLGVWYPHKRFNDKEAGRLYTRLCEGDSSGVVAHPAIDDFYKELTALHPEIDTIPEERVGDFEHCPWSCALDRSPGHLIMACVWSKATYVHTLVEDLARKHGLAVYDPQSDRLTYPDNSSEPKSSAVFRWILCALALVAAVLFFYLSQTAESTPRMALYLLGGLCVVAAAVLFKLNRK
jgi:hypothetical protein